MKSCDLSKCFFTPILNKIEIRSFSLENTKSENENIFKNMIKGIPLSNNKIWSRYNCDKFFKLFFLGNNPFYMNIQ